jgi:hypothetical protein
MLLISLGMNLTLLVWLRAEKSSAGDGSVDTLQLTTLVSYRMSYLSGMPVVDLPRPWIPVSHVPTAAWTTLRVAHNSTTPTATKLL